MNLSYLLRHGLVVRIAGSHPAGPGSIPGAGINKLFVASDAFTCSKSMNYDGRFYDLSIDTCFTIAWSRCPQSLFPPKLPPASCNHACFSAFGEIVHVDKQRNRTAVWRVWVVNGVPGTACCNILESDVVRRETSSHDQEILGKMDSGHCAKVVFHGAGTFQISTSRLPLGRHRPS